MQPTDKDDESILIFGTMGDIGPAVFDRLQAAGQTAVLVDFPQNTFRDEFGYHRLLCKSIALHQPTVIIPIGHQLAFARACSAALVPDYVRSFVESEEKIRLLDSKVDCSRIASEAGVPQPRIYASVEDAAPYIDSGLIFKREKSFGGSGVYRPRTLSALQNLAVHEKDSAFLIEELVEGRDISVDCIRCGSDFYAQCYETLSKSQGQGPAQDRGVTDNPLIVNYARKILDYVDYNGVCGMDFRLDNSGNPYFLECNPRFTGGLRTQLASGFDLIGLYCRYSKKGRPDEPTTFKNIRSITEPCVRST